MTTDGQKKRNRLGRAVQGPLGGLRGAFFSLYAVMLFFCFAELAVSLFFPGVKPPVRSFMTPFAEDSTDRAIREAIVRRYYVEDPELFWKLNPAGTEEISPQGFRNRKVYGAKGEGTLRVLALGDSCTYGVGAPRETESYPRQLEAILKERLPGTHVEVINAAVPGYSSFQGMRYLKRLLPLYRPNIVLIQFGHNDHEKWAGTSDMGIRVPSPWLADLREELRSWRFYEALRRAVLRGKKAGGGRNTPRKTRVSPEEYANNLRNMVRMCREAAAAPVIMTQAALPPYRWAPRFRDYESGVHRVASETGVPLVDFATFFDRMPDAGDYFANVQNGDLAHLNGRGYRLEAEEAASVILEMATGDGERGIPPPSGT